MSKAELIEEATSARLLFTFAVHSMLVWWICATCLNLFTQICLSLALAAFNLYVSPQAELTINVWLSSSEGAKTEPREDEKQLS